MRYDSEQHCKNAQLAIDRGHYDQAQAHALTGILSILSSEKTTQVPDLEGKVLVGRDFFDALLDLAVAAREFFTAPSDSAFGKCLAILDEWDRKANSDVSDI